MLNVLKQVPEVLSKAWGASKNILPLLPAGIEALKALFQSKQQERNTQMSGILERGFDGMKDLLQVYAHKSEGLGDLAVITEQLFEKPENKTIFDTLSGAYLILEKIPLLGSYVESMIAKIPGFLKCIELLDSIFGTTFKKRIEEGDGEATSQAVQMLLQIGDLIMTQVNLSTMKTSMASKA